MSDSTGGDRTRGGSCRRGFNLIEMTIAATLLGVVFAVLGQFLARWEAARRSADDRTFALQTLECVLERAAAEPGADIPLPAETEVRLRSPQLEFDRSSPDDAGLIAVRASLSWQNAEGQRVSPVTLTAWVPAARPGAGGTP